MAPTPTAPSLPPQWLRSTGNVGIGVQRHAELDDRMIGVLSFTTVDRQQIVIEVTVDDLHGLKHDVDRLLTADVAQVAQWWQTLADGSDGRPRAPKPSAPCAAERLDHSSAARHSGRPDQ